MTMRAIQMAKTGGIEVLALAQVSAPTIQSNQVLVENHYAGVNFIDTYHRTGLYKVPLPFVPGREGSGIVKQVGNQVTRFKPGDRVCYGAGATYCELTAVNEEAVLKLPDHVSLEEGAAISLQGLTAISLAMYSHQVKKGETVLVHAAAGGTGLLLVQLCKHLGAKVIGTTSTQQKAQKAYEAGADEIIIYTEKDIKTEVMRITGGKGVQCVFDGVGKTTFDTSLQCLSRMGSMLSFGNASGKVDDIDIMKLVPNAIRLMRPSLFQFLNSREDYDRMMPQLQELLDKKVFKFHIHKAYALEDAGQAHADLESKGTLGKLVIKIK
ncbi:hypothetical protein EDD86DRAFT_198178, partial [Gorgonomyces haynaldii]